MKGDTRPHYLSHQRVVTVAHLEGSSNVQSEERLYKDAVRPGRLGGYAYLENCLNAFARR
jgi:hypothetical protein